jgi:sirohydrochlorin cobaltochelatase
VAQRRIAALCQEGAAVTVVAPEAWADAAAYHSLVYLQQHYTPECLAHAKWVFACTDDPALNRRILEDARKLGCYASSATATDVSDFLVPASRRSGNVTFAVSTEGTSPGLSAAICREMEGALSGYAALCAVQQQLRTQWKQDIPDPAQRREAVLALSSPEMLDIFAQQGADAYLRQAQKRMPQKKEACAILVISFGTSYADTREKTIGAVERAIQSAIPHADVYRAFTSQHIIRKMRKNGIAIDSVPEALQRLQQQGYTQVYCQPTHVIPGEEYDKLCAQAAPFAHAFSVFRIGKPLLHDTEDFCALADALRTITACPEDTAYVLMGHGTAHAANMAYPAFAYWLKQRGVPRAFVGTVEGSPTLDTVLQQLRASSCQKVILMPLMLVAGDHAQNDMAAEADDASWKSILERQGYPVSVRLCGLGEFPAIQDLYVRHVKACMQSE